MSWTAIVPIKPPGQRKTRLDAIDPQERQALTEGMLAHVLAVLHRHPRLGQVTLLARAPVAGTDWIADGGRGLNAELTAARAGIDADVLVLHADLPLLGPEDVDSLLDAAEKCGAACAPDRHGTGTNALALRRAMPFIFRFGPDSRGLHAAQLPPEAVVDRPGLALDVDTPEDLRLAGR